MNIRDRKEVIEAKLLSNNNGQVFRINNEIYLGYPGYKILPEIPENLIAMPTLMWLYDSYEEGAMGVEISYLTNGMGWKADYIVVLNREDTKADLSGWVTVNNKSGTSL